MRLLASALCLLASLLACNTLFPPRPEVRWEADPNTLVISADTCCGMLFDPNGIPDARLWGDGRLIWVEYDGSKRRVVSAALTAAEMTSLLQIFVEAGFFGWKDYYAPAEPIYDAPSTCIHITLVGESKSVCETVEGAPKKFGELYANVTSGAGVQGTDYVPMTGYLQSTVWQVTDSGPPAPEWPVESTGLSLKDALGGVWVDGEALRIAWETVNAEPLNSVVQEGDQFYTLILLIPNITRTAPPAPIQ